MNKTVYKTIKMSIGFTVAIIIATVLNLDFIVSAGVITMLNLQESKVASARAAWRRFYSAAIGLVLAATVFSILGFTIFHLGLFLLLFIPITLRLNASEGIIVNTVLASHLLADQQISMAILLNEISLVIIGAGVSVLMNLHMPNYKKDLLKAQEEIDKKIRALLWTASMNMRNLCTIHDEEPSIKALSDEIKTAQRKANLYLNNSYLSDDRYFLDYFKMRQDQVYRLKYMREHLDMVFINQDEAYTLSHFTGRLAYEFDTENNGLALIERLQEIRRNFQSAPLPASRMEFESRAALFQYLTDLKEFIDIKVRFSEKYASDDEAADDKDLPI